MATSSQPPVLIEKPLLNSIPVALLHRFDPTYVEYYNKYSAGRLATHQVPIETYRKDRLAYTISYGRQIVDTGGLIITEEKCPVEGGKIAIRIFQPGRAAADEKPRPVYINFHGGGLVFGGLATDKDFCKRLVHELGCIAFDVDYRLSPEFKFPIPVNDCWSAFNWVRENKSAKLNLDLNKVAIGGCYAGGHLSAVIAHKCRDEGISLAFQLLGVPVCDMHVFTPTRELREDCPYESYREMYYAQPLPTERMSFKDLVAALILTAEMDPLRDEGEAYGKKMNEARSQAEFIRVKGAPHTFMQLGGILKIGRQYNRESVRALGQAFGVRP
ncbi:hypothetical protein GQ53DRAFT_865895 [Thozetella sp. PMI_491]|nr:hypothetical protein GQ53DRAFT_865895 [Thozetella sp. PMI_491]